MFGFLSKVTDPVCKMDLDKNKFQFSWEHEGQKYYFCSLDCKNKFVDNPKLYLTPKRKSSCCH